MAAYPSFNLPRFSGSTLEPTVEPVAFMPSSFYHNQKGSSVLLLSPSSVSSVDTSTMDEDNDFIPPPSSSSSFPSSPVNFSLNRPNRPTFIHIPSTCKTFDGQHSLTDDQDNFWLSPQERDYNQTESEFEWDESGQTVYKRSNHHHHHHHHIFWSA